MFKEPTQINNQATAINNIIDNGNNNMNENLILNTDINNNNNTDLTSGLSNENQPPIVSHRNSSSDIRPSFSSGMNESNDRSHSAPANVNDSVAPTANLSNIRPQINSHQKFNNPIMKTRPALNFLPGAQYKPDNFRPTNVSQPPSSNYINPQQHQNGNQQNFIPMLKKDHNNNNNAPQQHNNSNNQNTPADPYISSW